MKKREGPSPVQVGKALQYDVDIDPKLETISKMRLSPHGDVAFRLKVLTYCRVCCAFSLVPP